MIELRGCQPPGDPDLPPCCVGSYLTHVHLHPASRSLQASMSVRYVVQMRLGLWAVSMSLGLCGCVHPATEPQARPPQSVRVGSIIPKLNKVRDVPPVYPPAAIAAKVEGVVVVEARIDATGRVTAAKIIRSIALLDDAALDAVRQWEFEPTVIDGLGRVPIIAALSVSFKLP
jgi:TonB family protein